MRTVVYTSPFVPAEWIAAHGLRPGRIRPRSIGDISSLEPVVGVCPYARAFAQEVLNDAQASAAIVTTTCDQMRRMAELLARRWDRPVFLMNVPSTWQTPAVQALYREELERLGRFLVELGGEAPSCAELAKVMLEVDRRRSSFPRKPARASWGKEPRASARAVAGQLRRASSHDRADHGVPLALVGGPMSQEDFAIFDLVEQAGGCIVLDATETGERTLPAPFDRCRVQDDPLTELTRAYFGTIPDAFRRPNDGLYTWLLRELRDRQVRGIIFQRYVWCDIWGGELYRLKEGTGVPVLDLQLGDDAESIRSIAAGRIQAFMEMLR